MATFEYNPYLAEVKDLSVTTSYKREVTLELKKLSKEQLDIYLICIVNRVFTLFDGKDKEKHHDITKNSIELNHMKTSLCRMIKAYEMFYNQKFKAMVINYLVFNMLSDQEVNDVNHVNPTIRVEAQLACIKYALAQSKVKF